MSAERTPGPRRAAIAMQPCHLAPGVALRYHVNPARIEWTRHGDADAIAIDRLDLPCTNVPQQRPRHGSFRTGFGRGDCSGRESFDVGISTGQVCRQAWFHDSTAKCFVDAGGRSTCDPSRVNSTVKSPEPRLVARRPSSVGNVHVATPCWLAVIQSWAPRSTSIMARVGGST
jgi:hypothetical protein